MKFVAVRSSMELKMRSLRSDVFLMYRESTELLSFSVAIN